VAEVAWEFPARSLTLIGVTGTNGKTTTAHLIREILVHTGLQVGLVGTVKHHTGVPGGEVDASRTTPPPFALQPLLRRMVDAGTRWAVMEVSSHALDQRRTGSSRFAAAVFTNLSGDHLDYHGHMDRYFAA
jgi:UDP-N-acetylmuramoyl-L-alanyl-D-glutamate--2,6-diaminopimelate ligase